MNELIKFNERSDVDFAVDFDKDSIDSQNLDWADLFFDFVNSLENLLGRKVDMVFDSYISNHIFRKELDSKKLLIYESNNVYHFTNTFLPCWI